jgi:hypothetical protein
MSSFNIGVRKIISPRISYKAKIKMKNYNSTCSI